MRSHLSSVVRVHHHPPILIKQRKEDNNMKVVIIGKYEKDELIPNHPEEIELDLGDVTAFSTDKYCLLNLFSFMTSMTFWI